jgi:uncharacterized protein
MRTAFIDLAIVAGGYLLAYFGLGLAEIPYGGVAAIVVGVALATWRLRAAAESWRSVGLRRPERPLRVVLAALALYGLVVLGMLLIVEPLSRTFGWPGLDLTAYAQLQGDPLMFAAMLGVAWTSAAVGEELLFRGFLLNRLETALGAGGAARVSAVVLQAIIFALAHAYLGPRGVASAALVAVVFGAWYVRYGRNLWPLILAHGLTDTLTLAAIYAGLMPV